MPINDDKATSLVIGLSLDTRKEHIVRAVLESLAFRFALLYDTVLKETKTPLSSSVKYDIVSTILQNSKLFPEHRGTTRRRTRSHRYGDNRKMAARE